MEKPNNEQTEQQVQTAVAENDNGTIKEEVSLGKFKNVDALLSAYNSLEAEFTKRCQKIKELESAISSFDKEKSPTEREEIQAEPKGADITEEDKNNILKEYLQGVIGRKQKAVLFDGVGIGVKTPESRPKTISQAGMLAREILDK